MPRYYITNDVTGRVVRSGVTPTPLERIRVRPGQTLHEGVPPKALRDIPRTPRPEPREKPATLLLQRVEDLAPGQASRELKGVLREMARLLQRLMGEQ